MPTGAVIGEDKTVTWIVDGKKKRTGTLSKTGRVSVQARTWTAQFTDETGKVRRVSTKTTTRSIAEKILAQHEREVDRIRLGIVTREELEKALIKQTSLNDLLGQFRTKMTASGNTATYINSTFQKISALFQDCRIDAITKIRRESIERWVADEIKRGVRSARTINSYIAAIKAFVLYLADTGVFISNPLKSVRKLNEELDRRKIRRAMTKEEIDRLLKAAAEEHVLIYRLLLGTGLRSTELSLITPNQFDFEHCLMRIEASQTKNKRADILPVRADLIQALCKRIETRRIKPHERIFDHNQSQIRRAFYLDLQSAGIERRDMQGRCIDVHSMRKTFGTMLATAGVPLTTVQRLMRHSSPQLTAKLYIDVDPINMKCALEQLPSF